MDEIANISFGIHQDLCIKTVMIKLGYNDVRSALRWCKKNGVIVFVQGKKHLVNQTQFLASYYKPFISQLKEQYPKKWVELFKSYIKEDFEKVMEMMHPKQFVKSSKRYKPQSESSKMFLTRKKGE